MLYNKRMIWEIDPRSSRPLYEQLADAVRHALATGRLSRGERLPSARELAASLDINMHTVLRAYQELRDAGLVELRRGRGAVVVGPGASAAEQLREQLATAIARARELGLSLADVDGVVAAVLREQT